jgi:hypothetical protein
LFFVISFFLSFLSVFFFFVVVCLFGFYNVFLIRHIFPFTHVPEFTFQNHMIRATRELEVPFRKEGYEAMVAKARESFTKAAEDRAKRLEAKQREKVEAKDRFARIESDFQVFKKKIDEEKEVEFQKKKKERDVKVAAWQKERERKRLEAELAQKKREEEELRQRLQYEEREREAAAKRESESSASAGKFQPNTANREPYKPNTVPVGTRPTVRGIDGFVFCFLIVLFCWVYFEIAVSCLSSLLISLEQALERYR